MTLKFYADLKRAQKLFATHLRKVFLVSPVDIVSIYEVFIKLKQVKEGMCGIFQRGKSLEEEEQEQTVEKL
ncbi:hypothetical protein [Candidatus Uabimicrobium sp. HlEnr_7]|uniref:hypothetical protein n=1 Tax=Candidatus Uabimicrobium helgolandensis TaxID=3095367 RepID=UPI00355898DC